MKEETYTSTWQQTARAVLNLLAERDLPLQRRGQVIQGSIRVRLRPHPACGAPVFELLAPNVRGGFALGWRDFETVAKSARGIARSYKVTIHCPDFCKRDKVYRIVSSSNSNAWTKGWKRFVSEFPAVLERGLPFSGGAEIIK